MHNGRKNNWAREWIAEKTEWVREWVSEQACEYEWVRESEVNDALTPATQPANQPTSQSIYAKQNGRYGTRGYLQNTHSTSLSLTLHIIERKTCSGVLSS